MSPQMHRLTAEMAAVTADNFRPVPFRVVRKRRETRDTYTLFLAPPEGYPYAFLPGQFNMLYAYGVGEVPISISGNPFLAVPVAHTVRRVGAVTRALTSLQVGDIVGLRGPFGHPWPMELAQGKDVIIVGGGIGLAPLRPCIYHILEHRQDFGRVVLLYGARTPGDLLYRRELERWRGRFDIDVLVTVDRGDTDWHGHVGVVTTLFTQAERMFDGQNAVAFICGPEVMIRFTVRELLARGVSGDDIFVSMERNMKCGQGLCGHCQFGPHFVCKDGPVFPYSVVEPLFGLREV